MKLAQMRFTLLLSVILITIFLSQIGTIFIWIFSSRRSSRQTTSILNKGFSSTSETNNIDYTKINPVFNQKAKTKTLESNLEVIETEVLEYDSTINKIMKESKVTCDSNKNKDFSDGRYDYVMRYCDYEDGKGKPVMVDLESAVPLIWINKYERKQMKKF